MPFGDGGLKPWKRIQALTKKKLLELIEKYDRYVVAYAEAHGECKDGCYPVCFNEFAFNDTIEP